MRIGYAKEARNMKENMTSDMWDAAFIFRDYTMVLKPCCDILTRHLGVKTRCSNVGTGCKNCNIPLLLKETAIRILDELKEGE